MSAPMPGWLTRILTDADSADDIASTLILAADDLEDGTATTVDLRRWGHEIRGDMRDNHAELAAPQSVTAEPLVDGRPVSEVWCNCLAPDSWHAPGSRGQACKHAEEATPDA